MAALQVKKICMYLDLGDLPKIINTKENPDLLKLKFFPSSHVYIYQKYMAPPKPFKKYYDRKCSHSSFSIALPKAKNITQIRPDDQNKGERKVQSQSKGSNFGTYTYK